MTDDERYRMRAWAVLENWVSPVEREHLLAKLKILGESETRWFQRFQDLKQAVLEAKQGECWCLHGTGHPLVHDHSEACKTIQELTK